MVAGMYASIVSIVDGLSRCFSCVPCSNQPIPCQATATEASRVLSAVQAEFPSKSRRRIAVTLILRTLRNCNLEDMISCQANTAEWHGWTETFVAVSIIAS